jgi:hypothetical protein
LPIHENDRPYDDNQRATHDGLLAAGKDPQILIAMIEKIAFEKGYRIDEHGCLSYKGRPLSGHISKGYFMAGFRKKDGGAYNFSAHRLQAFQKYGDDLYKPGIQVRHLNSNPLDNSYKNIAIGNASENAMDKSPEKRMAAALIASSFIRKYDRDIVTKFHKESGGSYKKTMLNFGISSKGTLHFILNGRR